MSFITKFINYVKRSCCPFLLTENPQESSNDRQLEHELIEKKHWKDKHNNQQDINANSNNIGKPQKNHGQVGSKGIKFRFTNNIQVEQLSAQSKLSKPKEKNKMVQSHGKLRATDGSGSGTEALAMQQKPLIIRKIESQQDYQDSISNSASSFRTVKSNSSRPVSRRNFKILRKSTSKLSLSQRENRASAEGQQFYSFIQDSNSLSGSRGKEGNRNTNNNSRFHFQSFNNARMTSRYNAEIDFYNYQQNDQAGDIMNLWFKKQYNKVPIDENTVNKINLSQITKMKLQKKDEFDNLVHRLEDYYTFYYEERQMDKSVIELQQFQQQQQVTPTFNLSHRRPQPNQSSAVSSTYNYRSITTNPKNQRLQCSLNITADHNKSFDYERTCKYMSICIITQCTVSPFKFLQWFNKQEIQAIFHNFYNIQYIQDSQFLNKNGQNSIINQVRGQKPVRTLDYPLFTVQQYDPLLKGKQTFTLARQVEVVAFVGDGEGTGNNKSHQQQKHTSVTSSFQQENESLMEVLFQAVDCQEKCYERLVRVICEGNDGWRVQIYTESSENIVKSKNKKSSGNFISNNKGSALSNNNGVLTNSMFLPNNSSLSHNNIKQSQQHEHEHEHEIYFFQERWAQFERRLVKDKIVKVEQSSGSSNTKVTNNINKNNK